MAMNICAINEMRFRFSARLDFISHASVLSEARDLAGIVFVGCPRTRSKTRFGLVNAARSDKIRLRITMRIDNGMMSRWRLCKKIISLRSTLFNRRKPLEIAYLRRLKSLNISHCLLISKFCLIKLK